MGRRVEVVSEPGRAGTPRGQARKGWLRPSILAAAAGALLLLCLLGAMAVLEGDLPDAFADLGDKFGRLLHGHGVAGAAVALYLEESGVPMPLPGDIFVMYAGKVSGHHVSSLLTAWFVLTLAVELGATNLFLLSRRFGRRLASGRPGHAMHLTPARLQQGERWFQRWGALALIFGRHVPGCRVPITVAAGALRVGYPVFAASVAVSTAIWIAVYLVVGATVGGRLQSFLALHRMTYYLAPAAALILIAYFGYRFIAYRGEEGPEPEQHPEPQASEVGESTPRT